jgi:putative chitinase
MIDRATAERLQALLGECAGIIRDNLAQPEVASVVQPAPIAPIADNDDASFAFADYGKFFDHFRRLKMLGPTISADEFRGCNALIRACAVAGWPISYTAYALATAYHETAHTMLPIKERGGTAYYTRMYDINGNRPAKAAELGNMSPGDGAKFAGRGYVQLTGKFNYAKATAKLKALGLNVDLVRNPDQAMEPQIAALILVYGMIEGWFTTRKLPDDLPASGLATTLQFKRSRDIINGSDMDDEIAAYAVEFQRGLAAGGYKIAA